VLGLVAALGLLAAFSAPRLALSLRDRDVELERLAQQNDSLRGEKDRFEQELSQLAHRLNRFEAQAGRLAAELGVEVLEPAAGGEGGPDAAGPDGVLAEELGALSFRTERLGSSMDELDQAFQERVRLLAATPNRMPVQGWFSHGFGWRKDPWTGARQFHRGIDIVAHAGTEIRAPADGIVSQATRKSDYGKMIDLSHGYGFVTRYAHLSEVLVRPGQRVSRGDLLGRVGSTGRSTGPHLHYEVFRDGRRVNPWKYLGQR
jgi:murein DD-endopeptidase MepM/ murein hydrolase activator NlpD